MEQIEGIKWFFYWNKIETIKSEDNVTWDNTIFWDFQAINRTHGSSLSPHLGCLCSCVIA